MYASDFRAEARRALKGMWGTAIGVTLVAFLLGGGLGGSSSGSSSGSSGGTLSSGALGAFSFLLIAYVLVVIVLGGAVELGLKLFNIRLVTGKEQRPFTTLFERFDIFGRALGLRLTMGLFVFLWSLLLIVPGIIASYSYAIAPYLVAENPDMGIMEAISQSKLMMMGNKGRLFCLRISFFGWALLSVLTLGVGLLWLNPYICAAEAAFYLHLRSPIGLPNGD